MSIIEILFLIIVLLCQSFYIVYNLHFSKRRFVRKSDLIEIEDQIEALAESFKKFRCRYSTKFYREEKENQENLLMGNISNMIENLPLDENTKKLIKDIPPEILETIIKKIIFK